MKTFRSVQTIVVAGALSCACAATVAAQAAVPPVTPPTASQPPAAAASVIPGPTLRRIESAQAISTETLGAISQVRHLADGRVLVNDGTRRRLLMLDSSLKLISVVLDSLTEVENAYGTRAGTLIPYLGDSTLFVDPATLAMLILDGEGRIARVRAVPRAQDVNAITNTSTGWPGFDVKGRFVYRITAQTAPPAVAPPPGMPWIPSPPDSAFIVGLHLDTRKIDTLGVIRTPKIVYSVRMEPEGGYSMNTIPNPLPLTDDWGLLADGSIAFVRGIDYRVEFRAPDGTITSSEKLPFPWVRMTEDDKTRFADSAKTVMLKNAQTNFATQMIAWSNLLNKPYPASFTPPEGYVPPAGLPKDWILPKGVTFPANYVPACPPGTTPPSMNIPMPVSAAAAAPATPAAPGAPNCTQTYFSEMYGSGYTPPAPTYRAPTLIKPRDLPDYKPPIATTSVRTDADGNVWIRAIPMRPTPGGPTYDVVNRQGEMIDRVQLPQGYQLMGFGKGKIVYLSNRDATGLHLSRVRLK